MGRIVTNNSKKIGVMSISFLKHRAEARGVGEVYSMIILKMTSELVLPTHRVGKAFLEGLSEIVQNHMEKPGRMTSVGAQLIASRKI